MAGLSHQPLDRRPERLVAESPSPRPQGTTRTFPVRIVVLLDDRRDRARGADPVAAHDQRSLLPALVEVRRVERIAVVGAELEDMTNLDRCLEGERASTVRAAVAFFHASDVREARTIITVRLDPEQMPAVAVRAGHVLAVAEELVGDDLDVDVDG